MGNCGTWDGGTTGPGHVASCGAPRAQDPNISAPIPAPDHRSRFRLSISIRRLYTRPASLAILGGLTAKDGRGADDANVR